MISPELLSSKPGELCSGEIAGDTIEALVAEQGPDRPAIFWILILLLGAILVSLPFIKIDLRVRARGVVHLDTSYSGEFLDGRMGNGSPSVITVEAFLREADIKFLRIGQACTLQYDAYPYTDWGMALGTVVQISNEPVIFNHQALFKVVVQSKTGTLHLEDGRSGQVINGMAVNLRFVVNRKSLLHLIYQKSEILFGT